MSLITCNECGGKVSDKAKACPHCGAPIEVVNANFMEPIEQEKDAVVTEKATNKKQNRYSKVMNKAISDYEKSIATIILLCIQDLEFQLGVNKLVQILTGTQTKFITDYELQNNLAFSLLKQYRKQDIKEVIEVLEIMGYIQQETVGWNIPVICLTDKAYDFLDGREEFEGSFIDVLSKSDFIELTDEQTDLYEYLRRKRAAIAKENDAPAYTVCYDRVLRVMALNKPRNDEELLTIKGIGPAFIEKYGEKFIKAIGEFEENL